MHTYLRDTLYVTANDDGGDTTVNDDGGGTTEVYILELKPFGYFTET